MLLFVANEVTRAVEYVPTARIVAGMWVGIDAGTSRSHPFGNSTRHCRCSGHACIISRQCWGSGDVGNGGKRYRIEACHSRLRDLRIDSCQIIPVSKWVEVSEVIGQDGEVIVDTKVSKLEGWIRVIVWDGI